MYKLFFETLIAVLLSIHLKVELLDHMVTVLNVLMNHRSAFLEVHFSGIFASYDSNGI